MALYLVHVKNTVNDTRSRYSVAACSEGEAEQRVSDTLHQNFQVKKVEVIDPDYGTDNLGPVSF